MIPKITFRAINYTDIPLMHQWFNTPHVQAFYSLRKWTEAEVLAKLKPYIEVEKPVRGFMILLDEKTVGYLQSYKVSDFPWPNQNLSEEIIKNAAGLDLFIGDAEWIGKGLGSKIIKTFIDAYVCPEFQYCIVDPDINNQAAIRCYEKLNFKEHAIIDSLDALQRPTKLKLMLFKCHESG